MPPTSPTISNNALVAPVYNPNSLSGTMTGTTVATTPVPKVAPAVVTAKDAATKVTADTQQLQQIQTAPVANNTNKPNAVDANGNLVYVGNPDINPQFKTLPMAGSVDYTKLSKSEAMNIFGTDFTGLKQNADGTFTPDSTALNRVATSKAPSGTTMTTGAGVQPDLKNITVDPVTQQFLDQAKTLAGNIDARTTQMIANIEKEYQQLAYSQGIANQAYTGGVTTEGFRSGRNRYAPSIAMGDIAASVAAGTRALADLETKKQALIAQAQEARDAKQFEILSKTMDAYRNAIKDQREVAQQMYTNTITASQEARAAAAEARTADKTAVENAAPALARALSGVTDPAQRATLIEEYAKAHNVDATALQSGIQNYEDTQNAKVRDTIGTLAGKYSDAGITTEDFRTGNLSAVMEKVANSKSFQLGNAKTQAEISKAFYEAEKAKFDISGGTGTYAPEIDYVIKNGGKLPTGIKAGSGKAELIYNMAKEAAKDTVPSGTIVYQDSGFQVPSGQIPAATLTKVGSTITSFDQTARLRELLGQITTSPLGRAAAALGKLPDLTSEQVIEFNNIRDAMTAAYVQSISGVAVNEAEYKRLSNLVPNSNEWKNYSLSKLNTFEDNMKNTVKNNLGVSGATIKGIDLRTSADFRKEAEPLKANLQKDEMLVRDLNGNIGSIKKTEFDGSKYIQIFND